MQAVANVAFATTNGPAFQVNVQRSIPGFTTTPPPYPPTPPPFPPPANTRRHARSLASAATELNLPWLDLVERRWRAPPWAMPMTRDLQATDDLPSRGTRHGARHLPASEQEAELELEADRQLRADPPTVGTATLVYFSVQSLTSDAQAALVMTRLLASETGQMQAELRQQGMTVSAVQFVSVLRDAKNPPPAPPPPAPPPPDGGLSKTTETIIIVCASVAAAFVLVMLVILVVVIRRSEPVVVYVPPGMQLPKAHLPTSNVYTPDSWVPLGLPPPPTITSRIPGGAYSGYPSHGPGAAYPYHGSGGYGGALAGAAPAQRAGMLPPIQYPEYGQYQYPASPLAAARGYYGGGGLSTPTSPMPAAPPWGGYASTPPSSGMPAA
ncbi:hypothetical protein FOA52_012689 [Chlamydomonas sp. UWO 241]|nr:hypothetical protein FOA52_012689 [Chlamydomonas sp. UWO 241]